MGFLDKLKGLVSEENNNQYEEMVDQNEDKPDVCTQWIDGDKLREDVENDKINLEKKEQESNTIAVQINGSYEFMLEKNPSAERLNVNWHGIEINVFGIFLVFHASINCTIDEHRITIPTYYKIHMAGGMSEEETYLNLAERTEEEEREFIMDELKPMVIKDIRDKISEERYKQIKRQVEDKGKVRFDVVMDIEKGKLIK